MRLLFVLCLSLLSGMTLGEEPPADERTRKLDRVRELRDQASTIRADAKRAYEAAQPGCWKKFLVNACMEDARQTQRAEDRKARALDKEARDLEREVKRQDAAEREARRIEELPEKEADAAARAEKNRKAAEAARLKMERKLSGDPVPEAK